MYITIIKCGSWSNDKTNTSMGNLKGGKEGEDI